MIVRVLFCAAAFALCIALSTRPAVAQSPSQGGPLRDLKSIVDAQVLRVAVIHFDLPSFHVRAPDGTLRGPEIEMAQQIGRALGITQRKAEAIIYWTTILAWLVLPLVLLCTKMA
jgi:ABC-type amino acid transport substrate-binding protein